MLYVAKENEDIGIKKVPVLKKEKFSGWEFTEKFFVDSSGFGSEGELALTFNQFLMKVKKGYGYGISGQGQFQVYISEYKRKAKGD